jgi:hypothetical protein
MERKTAELVKSLPRSNASGKFKANVPELTAVVAIMLRIPSQDGTFGLGGLGTGFFSGGAWARDHDSEARCRV